MGFYETIYVGLWDDDKLDGLPFEGKGYFAFLFSNKRKTPSGIYRATDEQLAADTGLPIKKIQEYNRWLVDHRRIVRQGSWIFVRNAFKRKPKTEQMMTAVDVTLRECPEPEIVHNFFETYPLFKQRSPDLWQTVNQGSPDTSTSTSTSTSTKEGKDVGSELRGSQSSPIDPSLQGWLAKTQHLQGLGNGRHGAFWEAIITAYDQYDWLFIEEEIKKADAWMAANPSRKPTERGLTRFFRSWLERAVDRGRKQHGKA